MPISYSPEQRKKRVEHLSKQIDLLSMINADNIKARDKLINPLFEELWQISKIQITNNELQRGPGKD